MEISTYVGSSAGAIISCYLAAGYTLDNIVNSFLGRKPSLAEKEQGISRELPRLTYQKMFKILRKTAITDRINQLKNFPSLISNVSKGNWKYLMDFDWPKVSGIFSTSGIEQYMREDVLISNRFQDYQPDLFIVATQLNHSRKVVFGKFKHQPPTHDVFCQYDNNVGISDACAASVAIPVIYSPHRITNAKGDETDYIDGEIRETLSTHVAIDGGADLVIASYTHQPFHVGPEGISLTNMGLPSIVIQTLYLLIEQKITGAIHKRQSHRNAIDAVSQYCKSQQISEEHRNRICQLLEIQLNHRADVDMIYIHPDPQDTHMFFGDHFSLSPHKLADMVKSGFRAAIHTLRKYDFKDSTNKTLIRRIE